MTNPVSFANSDTTEPNTSRLTFSVQFLGMAPDEELFGLVRSFTARTRGPSAVYIERLPDRNRFRARVRGGDAVEHEDARHALSVALSRMEHGNNGPTSHAAS